MPSSVGNPLEQLSLDELRRRTSLKWRMHPDDVLPLWVAEMDVVLAEPVQEALMSAVTSGDTGYTPGTGYAEALQRFASARWGFDGIAVERTALVPDVMRGVVEVLDLLTDRGDTVVVNCPVYPPFYAFCAAAGRRVREAPLTADSRLDLDALADAFRRPVDGRTPAAYLLCNPHNPTGTAHTAGELAAVAGLAQASGVRVVVDEIHAPLVLPGASFVPYLSVPGAESGISVFSASKAWNLAGVKAALAVAGPEAADDLARLPEVVGHGPSHFGVLAHTAALASCDDWLDALLAALADNRQLLGDLLAEHLPAVHWTPPAATYLAWLDCRALTWDGRDTAPAPVADDPADVLLERARVALSAGAPFGSGGAGHVRLNFATSRAVLTEAVRRMGAVCTAV